MYLCKNGFVPSYEVWTFHSESSTRVVVEDEYDCDMGDIDRMDEILEAIQASEEPLHEHTEVTLLTFITRLMAIKSKYFFFNNFYNDLVKLIRDILSKPHKVSKDMYQSKKMMSALSLKYEENDVWPDNCILFLKEHANEKK
jgi:hypothetical protein